MTDPKTMKMLDKLARAIECLADADGGEAHVEAVELARDVMLLAAAEKPAEAAPVVTGDIQFNPEGYAISPTTGTPAHVDSDGWFGFANKERAGVYVEARGLESARRAVRAMRDAGLAAVRGEVVAAPTVAAVEFGGATGRAMLESGERATQTGPEGWSAEVSPDRKWLAIYVGLRPGEDAGETLAKMLAPVGRGS